MSPQPAVFQYGSPLNVEYRMTLHLELAPLLSIVAGIGILVAPKLLNYIVAAYLIVTGILHIVG